MTDLVSVLADFDPAPYANVLPSLERTGIRVSDLLALDAAEVAKQAQLPAREVRRLTDALLNALLPHKTREFSASLGADLQRKWHCISSLDAHLDKALGGGFPTGYLSEITGESGAGKTHLLLTLLLSVQLPAPHGLNRNAIYISTEAPLPTSRLSQLLETHALLSTCQTPGLKPSLNRILSISTPDLEAQEHILRYQVPVAIRRHDVGLVVIDSITANFRAEFEHRRDGPGERGPAAMARRSAQLIELGSLLRKIARSANVAVVVANQVADRFVHASGTTDQGVAEPLQLGSSAPSSSAYQPQAEMHDPMTLDHQQRWFSGWGDDPSRKWASSGLKTPSLGLVWTNQLACRVALTKSRPRGTTEASGDLRWKRHLKTVFAPWAPDYAGKPGVEFVIAKEGMKGIPDESGKVEDLA